MRHPGSPAALGQGSRGLPGVQASVQSPSAPGCHYTLHSEDRTHLTHDNL